MAKKSVHIEKHALVPKHSKLSDKQKEKLLQDYKVTEKDLPRILKDDMAIHGLDAKPGDVIKVIRSSMTAGETFFYRVVIDV